MVVQIFCSLAHPARKEFRPPTVMASQSRNPIIYALCVHKPTSYAFVQAGLMELKASKGDCGRTPSNLVHDAFALQRPLTQST